MATIAMAAKAMATKAMAITAMATKARAAGAVYAAGDAGVTAMATAATALSDKQHHAGLMQLLQDVLQSRCS